MKEIERFQEKMFISANLMRLQWFCKRSSREAALKSSFLSGPNFVAASLIECINILDCIKHLNKNILL